MRREMALYGSIMKLSNNIYYITLGTSSSVIYTMFQKIQASHLDRANLLEYIERGNSCPLTWQTSDLNKVIQQVSQGSVVTSLMNQWKSWFVYINAHTHPYRHKKHGGLPTETSLLAIIVCIYILIFINVHCPS